MKILCVLGKYNYGDPRRGLSHEYCNFIPAMRRLGHEVVFFDSKDRTRFNNFRDLNAALLSIVEQEKPNILFSVLTHYEIWRETLCLLRDEGSVATVNWTTDDSWRYESFSRFVAGVFHAMTTTYPQAYAKYKRDGFSNVLLTQWAANAETLREPLPASRCKYPVSFIGTAHGNRKQWIAALKERGIEVACFGYGWDSGPIPSEEIPRVIRESVISLNFANSALVWERGVLPRRHNQIKARVFEVCGAGGFLLTEWAPGIEKYYIPDQEIVVFKTIDELTQKISYYLTHPSERDAIAIAGFERTQREHTYDNRMAEVIEFTLRCWDEYRKNHASHSLNSSLQQQFAQIAQQHQLNIALKLIKRFLLSLCITIWGPERGPRAARRLIFELSWRVAGAKTYSASGWPGRMFYEVS